MEIENNRLPAESRVLVIPVLPRVSIIGKNLVWSADRLHHRRGMHGARLALHATPARVSLAAAGDALRVLAGTALGERLMATTALSDGVVYVHTETKLRAVGPAGG